MAEQEAWDRNRAAIVPVTIVLAFFWLNGLIDDDDQGMQLLKIGLFCMIPGAFIGIIIRLKTKASNAPEALLTIYAILSFVMSIVWINFTSNCIMDLL
jgi:hypothetical protein